MVQKHTLIFKPIVFGYVDLVCNCNTIWSLFLWVICKNISSMVYQFVWFHHFMYWMDMLRCWIYWNDFNLRSSHVVILLSQHCINDQYNMYCLWLTHWPFLNIRKHEFYKVEFLLESEEFFFMWVLDICQTIQPLFTKSSCVSWNHQMIVHRSII